MNDMFPCASYPMHLMPAKHETTKDKQECELVSFDQEHTGLGHRPLSANDNFQTTRLQSMSRHK